MKLARAELLAGFTPEELGQWGAVGIAAARTKWEANNYEGQRRWLKRMPQKMRQRAAKSAGAALRGTETARIRSQKATTALWDKRRRGEIPYLDQGGEKSPTARLTSEQVREMHQLRIDGWLIKDLAERYNMLPSGIHRILRGENWKAIYAEFH
jgi:hypothetical protein